MGEILGEDQGGIEDSMTWWNFLCYDCRWKGVANELDKDDSANEWYVCPKCSSDNIEDMDWHKEQDENIGN